MSKLPRGALVVVGSFVALGGPHDSGDGNDYVGRHFHNRRGLCRRQPERLRAERRRVPVGRTEPAGAASLPDGSYYVQITEPDGDVLGTSVGSGDDRPFVVSDGGLTVDCDQLSSIVIRGSDGTPGFDLTTNPGEQYKVWVCDNAQFLSSGCKADNFSSSDDGSGGGEDPPPSASSPNLLLGTSSGAIWRTRPMMSQIAYS